MHKLFCKCPALGKFRIPLLGNGASILTSLQAGQTQVSSFLGSLHVTIAKPKLISVAERLISLG